MVGAHPRSWLDVRHEKAPALRVGANTQKVLVSNNKIRV